ncbi:hypothetical protein JQ597_12420 [Bradyrhizobium sp. AUGA SZCCT0177]|uniref:hypothetical protein n=1 Tax=Bradyrhizobium sp. AUGA SZCCT0177 TaxID=2807665 RepID=UPI001BAD77B7|nr:hypothetical protein [Bradyrhizobium sp. AUGA SZCCT0177]MBR1282844.1 hypothetical protein [Bradyrhizobium sp. AUGA SZCCT0177]
MRELSAEARLHLYARSLSRRTGTGFHTVALYGSFALIAAIVFSSLSVHPF